MLQTNAVLNLDTLHPPSRFCPLGQIHSNQDLGSLPQLDDVDYVLQCRDGETEESDKLWPGKALQQGKGCQDGERNWRGHPMSEIECDEEEFVAGTDEEERCLVWAGGEERGSG